MFKVMIFARRRADLDRETFISLYENQHMVGVAKAIAEGTMPRSKDFRRNYLIKDHTANIGSPPDFDVVTEVWHESEATYAEIRAAVNRPEDAQAIMDELATFLDLTSLTYVVVEEHCGVPALNGPT